MDQPKPTDSAGDSSTAAIRAMIEGFRISRILYVAARLGLADCLKDEPMGCDELAQATGAHAPTLYRIMRALASVGIFAEDDQKRFALTPLSATLRRDTPGSLRNLVMNALAEERYQAWGGIMHTVRTGETAFDHVFGMGVWQYRAEHADFGAVFDQFMSNFTARFQAAIARYPFANFKKIVDVGGNDGTLMIAILQAHSSVRGVVVDLPRVTERAKRRIADAGFAERCEVIGSDAFQEVPAGADAYILSSVIHDWDDEHSIALLKSCRRAMTPNSRLLLIERTLPEGSDSSPAFRPVVMSDLNMMVMTGGRERTAAEYRALFEAAGLTLTNVTPTESIMSVIEGEPAA
jgi:hypothetical protein